MYKVPTGHSWICKEYRWDISGFVRSTEGHFWLTQSSLLRPNTSYVIRSVPYGWLWGMWCRSWLRHCVTSRKPQVRFPSVSLEYFIDRILPSALWPWGRLSLQQKWGKAAGAYGRQPYHFYVPIVSKSNSLNLVETNGPVIGLQTDCSTFIRVFIKSLQFFLCLNV